MKDYLVKEVIKMAGEPAEEEEMFQFELLKKFDKLNETMVKIYVALQEMQEKM